MFCLWISELQLQKSGSSWHCLPAKMLWHWSEIIFASHTQPTYSLKISRKYTFLSVSKHKEFIQPFCVCMSVCMSVCRSKVWKSSLNQWAVFCPRHLSQDEKLSFKSIQIEKVLISKINFNLSREQSITWNSKMSMTLFTSQIYEKCLKLVSNTWLQNFPLYRLDDEACTLVLRATNTNEELVYVMNKWRCLWRT